MALPSSGPISLSNLQTELGGSNPVRLSEYYAGGAYVGAGKSGTRGAVPSSGTLRIGDLYGTQAMPPSIVTGGANWPSVPVSVPGYSVFTEASPSGVMLSSTNQRSTDYGATWSSYTPAAGGVSYGMYYEAGYFFAGTHYGTKYAKQVVAGLHGSGIEYRSVDGSSWTTSWNIPGYGLENITSGKVAGNTRMVARVGNDSVGSQAMYSDDFGATWSTRTALTNFTSSGYSNYLGYLPLTASDGMFITSRYGEHNALLCNPTGVGAWTVRTIYDGVTAFTCTFKTAVVFNGVWYGMVYRSATSTPWIITTTDGVAFNTLVNLGYSNYSNCFITASPTHLFIALSNSITTRIFFSTNGSSWTELSNANVSGINLTMFEYYNGYLYLGYHNAGLKLYRVAA